MQSSWQRLDVKKDPLAADLGLHNRFCLERHKPLRFQEICTKLDELQTQRFKHSGVVDFLRLPFAREWNLFGNLYRWLNTHREMSLPDLVGDINGTGAQIISIC